MEFPFDREGIAFVVEVRGSIAPLVADRNRSNPEINQYINWNAKYGPAGSPDSREPTPDTTAEESIVYLKITIGEYPGNGYSFGRSSKCSVVLPRVGKKGISGTHFRIYVSEYRTWMLRNESRNGTTVIGEGSVFGSVALHPGRGNFIQVMDMSLTIHINGEWLLPFIGRTPAFPTSRNSSSGTSSSVFGLESIPEYEAGSNSTYHILEQRITPEGSQYRAVHTLTGRPVVAIRCIGDTMRSRKRYNLISTLSSQTDSIIPYLDFTTHDADDFIITKYVEGTTLEEYCLYGPLTDEELLGLYRQMIDCLCFLRKQGIEHGDIRQGTIIVTRPFKVCLAGFSKSTDIVSSLKVDITDLCRTYRSVALDTPDGPEDPESGSMRGDPEIATLVRQVLSSAPGNRMSASDINHHISSLVGDTQGEPFAMVDVTRSWKLEMRCKGKEVFVEVGALLDRLLAQRRHLQIETRSPEPDASRFLLKRTLFDGVAYCTSHQALKFCKEFHLEQFSQIIKTEVSKPTHSPVLIREGKEELFEISYHAPTMMFNLTHIAEVLGWRPALSKDLGIPQTFQEVYDEMWGGTYVDQSVCVSFLRGKHNGILKPIQEVQELPNRVLSEQFTSNSPKYILLFTGRLRPSMVALRRTDSFVNWTPSSGDDPKFLNPEESCLKCEAEMLPLLKRKILSLQEQPRIWNWSSWGPCLGTNQNDDSDTEVATDESDDEKRQFKFKFRSPPDRLGD
ncbi:hypothetical protein ACLOAV_010820 [Pseudogymnoascus australis]